MMSKNATAIAKDAITLLKDDHKRVKELFEEFKKFGANTEGEYDDLKQELFDATCAELKIHAQLEEEIFYPAVRKALPEDEDLLNEAEVEHASAKELIAEIEEGSADDPMTCARFTVLGEYIEHHVKEEENEMFPKAQRAKLDLVALGKKMEARKEEIKADIGLTPYDEIPSFAESGAEIISSLWDRIISVTSSNEKDNKSRVSPRSR